MAPLETLCSKSVSALHTGSALTAMDAQMLLQVMLVFKCFATFCAFEFAVGCRLHDVSLSDEGRGNLLRYTKTTFTLPFFFKSSFFCDK